MLFGGRQRVETIEKVEMEKGGRRDRSCWKIRKSRGKLSPILGRNFYLIVSIFKINVALPLIGESAIYIKLN